MARKLRLQYPGAVYHVMNRGDHSEVIFRDDNDRPLLLATLTEACEKADWQVHALCLMSNHFHFVLETPRASSYPDYLKPPERRPVWLRVDRLLGEWGIPVDSESGRHEFGRRMEARRQFEAPGAPEFVRRGWCVGSQQFRQELLLQMTTLSQSKFGGPEWQESSQKKAERLLSEELSRRGWGQVDLERLTKGHAAKVEIARRLRAQTIMTWSWIAEHLRMGSAAHAANACRNQP